MAQNLGRYQQQHAVAKFSLLTVLMGSAANSYLIRPHRQPPFAIFTPRALTVVYVFDERVMKSVSESTCMPKAYACIGDKRKRCALVSVPRVFPNLTRYLYLGCGVEQAASYLDLEQRIFDIFTPRSYHTRAHFRTMFWPMSQQSRLESSSRNPRGSLTHIRAGLERIRIRLCHCTGSMRTTFYANNCWRQKTEFHRRSPCFASASFATVLHSKLEWTSVSISACKV